MTGFGVVTDSGADLDPPTLEALGIGLVPLTVRFGDKEYVDQTELSTLEFWKLCESTTEGPATAAPSVGAFQNAFEHAAGTTRSVVCVTISSELSATHQSALAAAANLQGSIDVAVVDSRSATSGQGLLVRAAADMARAGTVPFSDATRALEDIRSTISLFGVLDTLEYLQRGGRIGPLKALLGQVMSFKPLIEVVDGKMEPRGRQRTRRRAVSKLVADAMAGSAPDTVSIAHALAPDIDTIVAMVREAHATADIQVSVLGPSIGSHVGPGAVGIATQRRAAKPN